MPTSEELRKSEEQFRALVDASAQIIWRTDAEGCVAEDSPSWRAFTGQSVAAWLSNGWLDAVHPDDRGQAELRWQEAVESEMPFDNEVRVYHAASGRYRWTHARAVPLRDADGAIYGWIGMNTDVDARRRAQAALEELTATLEQRVRERAEALRASEERYRTALKNSPVVFARVDAELRYEWIFNPHPDFDAAAMVGKRDDELDDGPGIQALIELKRRVFERGEQERREITFMRSDGARTYDITATPVREEEGRTRSLVTAALDVTERKRAEEQLQALNATLEARVEERTEKIRELAARLTTAEQKERRRISHVLHDQIQQLLFGAVLSARQVRRSAGHVADADVRAMQRMHLDQLEETLEEAMREVRTLSVELSPPVLQEDGLEEELAWLGRHMEKVYGLVVDLQVGCNVRMLNRAERLLLFQVARELLFNVVKHAGVHRATVELYEAGGRPAIRVADQGRGFDPSGVQWGAKEGVGLAAIRERIEFFGGQLEIESAPGRGTCVTASLPVDATRHHAF